MTTKQITWAMQHDWFVASNIEAGEVTVLEIETNSHKTFNCFLALREWAGY